MEASHCYPPGSSCGTAGLILPIMEYAHNASGGEAVIGGFFYPGFSVARLARAHLFGDLFCGDILAGGADSGGQLRRTPMLNHKITPSSLSPATPAATY